MKQVKKKEKKPTLAELIQEIEKINPKIKYNIEIKSTLEDEKAGFQPPVEEFTDLVIKTINSLLPNDRFSIQSFDWRVLNVLAKKYPEVTRVALIESVYHISSLFNSLDKLPQVFSPYYGLLTQQDIEYLHLNKIKVIPWTVNDTDTMKYLIKLGVDGIITDYPDLIEKL